MRSSICGFVFLAFVSLAQGQVKEVPSCRQFFLAHDEKYYLGNVRAFFDLAMHEGGTMSSVDQGLQSLGDGASVAVLKVVAPNDLADPKFVRAFLDLARTAFSRPELTACAEDKSPEVTLFLLDYLREKVKDENLKREIDSTKDYVLKQAGPARQSPFPGPSEPAK
jgi:hypothetical protein